MIHKRQEEFGATLYDTSTNSFSFVSSKGEETPHYPTKPLVLNVDLTFKCNLKCVHCVARDMATILGGADHADLVVTKDIIQKINSSEFMVIVLTGGEPLMPEFETALLALLKGLKGKAIQIDTNGTLFPSHKIIEILRSKEVLVRISWDIPHPQEEAKLRRYPKRMYKDDLEYLNDKQANIKRFIDSGVNVAIQTVLHRNNYNNNNLLMFPRKLLGLGIKDWYIQRFIPSVDTKKYDISIKEYGKRFDKIVTICKETGLRCHYKLDKRHNSVFLLVCDGDLYTQSDTKPGEKIKLGKIGEIKYFASVSSPDHADRYIV